jgi:hypothetical protein
MINKSSLMACALTSFLVPALAFNAVLPEKAADESTTAATTETVSLNLPFELTNKARIVSGRDRFQSTCAAFCHGHEPALFIGRDGLEPQYVTTPSAMAARAQPRCLPGARCFLPKKSGKSWPT